MRYGPGIPGIVGIDRFQQMATASALGNFALSQVLRIPRRNEHRTSNIQVPPSLALPRSTGGGDLAGWHSRLTVGFVGRDWLGFEVGGGDPAGVEFLAAHVFFVEADVGFGGV